MCRRRGAELQVEGAVQVPRCRAASGRAAPRCRCCPSGPDAAAPAARVLTGQDVEGGRSGPAEQVLDQMDIERVVLDQQDRDASARHRLIHSFTLNPSCPAAARLRRPRRVVQRAPLLRTPRLRGRAWSRPLRRWRSSPLAPMFSESQRRLGGRLGGEDARGALEAVRRPPQRRERRARRSPPGSGASSRGRSPRKTSTQFDQQVFAAVGVLEGAVPVQEQQPCFTPFLALRSVVDLPRSGPSITA